MANITFGFICRLNILFHLFKIVRVINVQKYIYIFFFLSIFLFINSLKNSFIRRKLENRYRIEDDIRLAFSRPDTLLMMIDMNISFIKIFYVLPHCCIAGHWYLKLSLFLRIKWIHANKFIIYNYNKTIIPTQPSGPITMP